MNNLEEKKSNKNLSLVYALSLGMTLGLFVAAPLVIFLLLGLYIDRKLNTLPLFLIIFILLSFVVAGLEVKNLILPFLEKRSQKMGNNNK
jgi:F0F1-type ATP synthase assembly protein I